MDRGRRLLVADQPLHQPRRAEPTEDVEGQGAGEVVLVAVHGQPPREVQPVVGHVLETLEPGRLGERVEMVDVVRRGLGRGRQRPEVRLHLGERVLRLDVADDGQHRVVRAVVVAEEGVDVLEARGVEVLHRPDRRVVVGVAVGEDRGVDVGEGVAVGHVVVALPLLLLDDVALVVEVLLGDRVEQVPVPVGLQPERELQGALGDRLEVVGPVEPGRRVEPAALGHQRAEVLAALDVARPLEHQVLEEVGKTRASGRFVPRPDAHPEVHGDGRDGVVLGDDHPQAVGQRALGDGVRDVSHGATIRDPADPVVPDFQRDVVAVSRGRAARNRQQRRVGSGRGRRGAARAGGAGARRRAARSPRGRRPAAR